MTKQRTIRDTVLFRGQGLHTGQQVEIKVHPSGPDTGILFCRTDLDPALKVRAGVENVRQDEMRQTALVVGKGIIRTVEHLMATFHGLCIDNAVVEVMGDELPGMDGSAQEFARTFQQIGLVEQETPRRFIEIKTPVFVDQGEQSIMVLPSDGLSVSYTLSYQDPDLNDQYMTLTILPEIFERELAPARTFCLKKEAEYLLSQGFGKGANVKNTLVFERNTPLENELRFDNEACRHKIMDLLGDLFLAGFVRGHVVAVRSGHSLNLELVRKIMQENKPMVPLPQAFGIQEIQRILPHRFPFLFVDRIDQFVPGVSAVGYKQVTMNDYFFQGHFPGHPVMPGVLIIEAMAQVGGVIMLGKPENRNKLAYFMSIDSAKFRSPVVPGDELRMEVEVIRNRARTGQCVGRAYVREKLVCEAEVKFAVVDK